MELHCPDPMYPPTLKVGAKLQQVTPRSWAFFSASRSLKSASQSLMSPCVQPLTNIWLQGEKQQATTLASLTELHLETSGSSTLGKTTAAAAEGPQGRQVGGNYR